MALEIDENVRIEELVEALPVAVRILAERGIVCIRCGEPYWGTLKELAGEKGITELDPILEELRQAAAHQGPEN